MDHINRVFNPYLDQFVVVFIDYILFYSKIPEELAHHLRTVLEVSRKNELYATLNNCKFWLEKVVFLGNITSGEGIFMDPQNMKAIIQWPRLKNAARVNSFLGLAGYYHRFVRTFLRLQHPSVN